jgi:CubicO group peptidase (beta-lactamase class C family)
MLEQLADNGMVHLSDPVNRYFPAVNTVQDRTLGAVSIALFELATHSSGLDREPGDEEKYEEGLVADWEKILISDLRHVHYISEPGTKYSYSNAGYAILGAALSHTIDGQPTGRHHFALRLRAARVAASTTVPMLPTLVSNIAPSIP